MIIDSFFLMIILLIENPLAIEDSNISLDILNVNVGKRIRLECELNKSINNFNQKGLWLRLEDAEVFFYSTSRIHSDQRFQIDQRESLQMINASYSSELITYALIIDDIRLSDAGTYSCQSDNQIIKLFRLNIVERPYFITHEYARLIRTQIGRNLSINCEAQGKPIPNLHWIKKVEENPSKLMINCSTSTTCSLDLVNVTRWHSGIYECVAMNLAGTIGRFYELDVQFPPDVSSLWEDLSYFVGNAVLIECLIDANPEPDIKWFHRFADDTHQEMDLSRQYSQENLDVKHDDIWYIKHEQFNTTRWKTTLFIKHLPRRLFNSKFLCRATNRLGSSEQSIIIREKHPPVRKSRPTTSLMYYSTVPSDIRLFTTTKFLDEETENFLNRSRRFSSDLFLLNFYTVFLLIYNN